MTTTNEISKVAIKVENLLDNYDYHWSHHAVDKVIDTWRENKGWIIDAFKKHPDYVEGEFLNAKTENYDREIDKEASREFSRWLLDFNVLAELPKHLPAEIEEQRVRERCSWMPDNLYWFLDRLDWHANRTISADLANSLNRMVPAVHAHEGQKTTRVINKLLTYLGYDKIEIEETRNG